MLPLGQTPHATDVLNKGADLLDELGFKWWLSAGTLLGIYRDGNHIPHDTDIDVAGHDVSDRFDEMDEKFLVAGFRFVRKTDYQRAYVYLGVIFDFYSFTQEGDEIVAYTVEGPVQTKPLRLFENLGEIEFEGRKYPVPQPIEDYLEVRYGPDWRTPKTSKDDWQLDTFCVREMIGTKEYRDYWTCRVDEVPDQTGATRFPGLGHLLPAFEALGVELGASSVLDVGCGSGRLSELCGTYHGVDIAPSQVEYCRSKGLSADLIDGPQDIKGSYDWVIGRSLFTHIDRPGRNAYLDAFVKAAPNLCIDIIPGPEGGDIGLMRAEPELFSRDLQDAGYEILGEYQEERYPEVHHYYRCRR